MGRRLASGLHGAVAGIALFGAVGFVAPASAQQITDVDKANQWVVTIQGNGVVSPTYYGAKTYSAVPFPSFEFRRAGQPANFESPDDGFNFALFGNHQFKAGLVGQYRSGRYNSSEADLYGIDSIPWAFEAGGFVEYWPLDKLRTRVSVMHGVKGNFAWSGEVQADWVEKLQPWTFSIGPRLEFGDAKFVNTYFGVSQQEADVNGLVTPYDPGGGITGLGGLAMAAYKFNDNWATSVYGKYERLVGDAADSPIVKNLGSPNQAQIGVTLSYTFGVSY